MRPQAVVLFLHLIVALCHPARAGETVRLVVDPWAPFGGRSLPADGISPDVITTVLERAGYRVQTSVVPWARALDGVKSGEYDLLGSVFFDEQLRSHLSFSVPYHRTDIRFLKRIGSPIEFTSVAALAPFSIAVGDGYLYEEGFDTAAGLNKRVVTSVPQGIRMVAGERVDLTLDSVEVLDHILHVQEPSLAERVEYVPGVLASRGVRFAIRNDFPDKQALLDAFERELRAVQADGTLAALLARHTGQQ